MAKLKAHGQEIGTVYLLVTAKRYMSDGKILKNRGFGWKLHAKCKPEFTPQQAFDRGSAKADAFLAERPIFAAYRAALHKATGLCKRWKLHSAIQLMPEDPDGVWSEVCDGYDNVHADVDEIAKLCQLYILAENERRERDGVAVS